MITEPALGVQMGWTFPALSGYELISSGALCPIAESIFGSSNTFSVSKNELSSNYESCMKDICSSRYLYWCPLFIWLTLYLIIWLFWTDELMCIEGRFRGENMVPPPLIGIVLRFGDVKALARALNNMVLERWCMRSLSSSSFKARVRFGLNLRVLGLSICGVWAPDASPAPPADDLVYAFNFLADRL
jgi:hypothetical protein